MHRLAPAILGLVCLCASAQSIEKALMPGKLSTAHVKFEETCNKCHANFDRNGQSKLCADCHKEIGKDLTLKRGFHGHLNDDKCSTCHEEHKGRTAKIININKDKFDHDQTGFKLRGGHKEISSKCLSCHVKDKKFRGTSKECVSCHRKDDVHKDGLGSDCQKCHNETKWKDAKFDHDKTKFKLQGEHAVTACDECHTDGHYKNTPLECYACHKEDDDDDGHHGKFGKKCATCHNSVDWAESTFDHGRATHYVLKGKHLTAECTSCHKATLYTLPKLQTKCVACHREDDMKKGHKGGLGDKCETCHNEQGWTKTSFNHDKETHFPLEGKHKETRCDSCHKSGVGASGVGKKIDKPSMACVSCHREDDQKKGHKGSYGEKCETCHGAKAWKPSNFNHDRDTHFKLNGKHRDAKCSDCHTGPLYTAKLVGDCYSCHRKNDEDKGHKGQLGKRCETCHNETNWKVEKFDHNKSRFPLVGSHAVLECQKCHLSNAFRDAPRICNGCHEKDDVHKRRFGTLCETCHNSRTWKSWDFDHDKTAFPLDGKHATTECYACHKAPISGAAKIGRSCINCHGKDDVHDGGFGGQCEQCHITLTWKKTRR